VIGQCKNEPGVNSWVVQVNVFDLNASLVSDYERFARSFTTIRAADIRRQVEALYASNRFWPEPLITINPSFEPGERVDELVRSGSLHESTARIFSINGNPISLYRHQSQAVAKAVTRQSFVVTTGTGSGKSLCFFIPIIDAAVRARAAREPARTRAIVIYPMNALANSQREEIDKFMKQSGVPENLRIWLSATRRWSTTSSTCRLTVLAVGPPCRPTSVMILSLAMP
jgi:ATP-dependent helicase YprA (DUF1998 family)